MEQNVDVVDLISNLLDSGKYREVISVPTEEKYADSFKDNCWDIISVVISKIQDDTIIIKPSLHSACEELLSTIIQKTAPEEALLEFIEQIEVSKNDAQFSIILSPLQHLLKKLSIKRGRSLEWCLNSISTYIERIPIPEHQLEAIRNSHRVVAPLASVSLSNTQKLIRNYCQSIPAKDAKVIACITAQEEYQYEENVKNRILENSLDFVTKHGWSVESLTAGAETVGYPSIAHGLFPNGGGDLVHYFNVKCNEKLVEQMKNWPKEDIRGAKVPTKFIENAIMTRLLMIDPYKNTWPKAMAIQTLPNNVSNCLATLLSLVDDICYYSGDRSVDFNWYIRRVGLAGIYKAAELFYLTDNSQDNTATRTFVTSRIRDAQLIQTALNLSPVSAAPQTLSAAFVTAKNILGINTLK